MVQYSNHYFGFSCYYQFANNEDLYNELNQASFQGERITNMFDGGNKERTERRKLFDQFIEKYPPGIFSNVNNPYLQQQQPMYDQD